MPQYRPDVLAPEPRDPNQKFWDPDAQTMDREQIRELQSERLRDLIRRVIDTPVPLFERKLESAGIESSPGSAWPLRSLSAKRSHVSTIASPGSDAIRAKRKD